MPRASGFARDLWTFVAEIEWVRRINLGSDSNGPSATSAAIKYNTPLPHSSPASLFTPLEFTEKWERQAGG